MQILQGVFLESYILLVLLEQCTCPSSAGQRIIKNAEFCNWPLMLHTFLPLHTKSTLSLFLFPFLALP